MVVGVAGQRLSVPWAALVVVMSMFGVTSAASAATRQAIAARPLAHALREDGSLRPTSGSFDARGYRMVVSHSGAPRFVKTAADTAAPAAAPTDDSLWSEGFGETGADASPNLNVVAVRGTDVFIGGSFTELGGHSGFNYHNIAEWDGYGWHTLGSGTSGAVNAIAFSGSTVLVGGSFTTAGGISAAAIASWSGGHWHSLGAGMVNTSGAAAQVDAIAVDPASSSVYAGGNFANADGQTANGIAMWNGTTWSPLSTGLSWNAFAAYVYAMVFANNTLYVGGNFTQAGSVKVDALAEWRGGAWSSVGGPGVSTSSGNAGTIYAMTRNPTTGTLYVGGTFAGAGGSFTPAGTVTGAAPALNVAAFDGTSWSGLGDGLQGTVRGLTDWRGRVYASGTLSGSVPVVATWTGSAWSAVGPGIDGTSTTGAVVASSTTEGVVAFGLFQTAANHATLLNQIGRWNGTTWLGFGLGIPASIVAVAGSDHDLYAAGPFTAAGYTSAASIAHFNGKSWTAMGTAGVTGTAGGCARSGVLHNICAIAIDPKTKHVYVGGNFSAIDGTSAANVAMWNGSSWQAMDAGLDGPVNALLIYNGKLYAGGGFHHADGEPANDVAQWDLQGGGWSALGGNAGYATGTGDDGDVNSLAGISTAPYNHYLIIGGGFPYITDGSTNYAMLGLASFDTSLSSYPSPVSGYGEFTGNGSGDPGVAGAVYALYASNTNIYVGGSFAFAGGLAANGFAKYNLIGPVSSRWSIPGSVAGAGGAVTSLTEAGGSIYLGGSFTSAGGVAASNVAKYTGGSAPHWAGLGSGVTGNNNPSVYAMAQTADGLYLGGLLGVAGATKPSEGLALWTGTAFPLTITNAASPSSVTVGNPVTFTATVTNGAAATASGVTVKAGVPASATFDSASSGCSLAAGIVTCSIGALTSGASATVQIVMTPASTGTLSSTATVRESGSSYTNSAKAKAQVS
jgi:trimeric autotransporter adhesin